MWRGTVTVNRRTLLENPISTPSRCDYLKILFLVRREYNVILAFVESVSEFSLCNNASPIELQLSSIPVFVVLKLRLSTTCGRNIMVGMYISFAPLI